MTTSAVEKPETETEAELPLVDADTGEHAEPPIFAVYLRETDHGDLLEATCPECLNGRIVERQHGRSLTYRCGCEQLLRVLG